MNLPTKEHAAAADGVALQASLGLAVKELRRKLGVTQEELAWRAGLHRSYLADIERGGRNVTLRSVANLAKALRVSVAALLEMPMDASAGRRTGEVLLVEDSPTDAALTIRAFKRARLANPVRVVRDGQEALDALFGRGRFAVEPTPLPQLVLLDLQLPKVSGLEVLREIKRDSLTRSIPVVVLTVSQRDETILECSRLGAANYLVKPVSFPDFARVTSRLEFYWKLTSSIEPGAATERPLGANGE